VPELEAGTAVERVRPTMPWRRKESPRSVMLRRVNEEKMKVVFCDESVVGNRKKKNKRSVFGDIEVDWFVVCLFGVNKVMSLVVVDFGVCVFKRG
jgi:hypothetical protein